MSLPADNIHKHSADPVDPCAPCNFPLGAGSHFVLVHLLTCFCFCYATDTFFPIETAKPTLKTQSLCLFSFPSSESAHMKLAWQQATWCLRQSGTLRGPQLPEPIPTPRTPPAATAEKTTVPWRARIKKTYTEDLWSRARACRWAAIWKKKGEIWGSHYGKEEKLKREWWVEKVTCMWPPDALPSNSKTPLFTLINSAESGAVITFSKIHNRDILLLTH